MRTTVDVVKECNRMILAYETLKRRRAMIATIINNMSNGPAKDIARNLLNMLDAEIGQ